MLRAVSRVPVVVITARDDEAEIIRVLDAGADDYVIKPFGGGPDRGPDPGRAAARPKRDRADEPGAARGRRASGWTPRRTRPPWTAPRSTSAGASSTCCTTWSLHAGQVVTQRDLLTHVWRLPYGGADKTVDVHVSWLRRKLGETAQQPRYLHTVRGVGIKLTAPSALSRRPARS